MPNNRDVTPLIWAKNNVFFSSTSAFYMKNNDSSKKVDKKPCLPCHISLYVQNLQYY